MLAGRTVWGVRSVRGKTHPLVLRFANAHRGRISELELFAENVKQLSAGEVRLKFVDGWTTREHPTEETATVAAVGQDQADLGWAGTRAFGCLGVRSLDPLQTPFLFEDYDTLAAVSRDEIVTEMLEPLESLGLVGLVVLPGPQRKPFAFYRRLLGPRDYEGARLRIHESLVAESTYRALGAEAVTLSVSQMLTAPEAAIHGLDLQAEALAGWRLHGSITFNVNLWPRTLALVASKKTYEWLGEAERKLLAAAAAKTLTRSVDLLVSQEERDRDAVPPEVTAIHADEDQIRALRERVEPVRDELRAHPETGHFLARLETFAAADAAIARDPDQASVRSAAKSASLGTH